MRRCTLPEDLGKLPGFLPVLARRFCIVRSWIPRAVPATPFTAHGPACCGGGHCSGRPNRQDILRPLMPLLCCAGSGKRQGDAAAPAAKSKEAPDDEVAQPVPPPKTTCPCTPLSSIPLPRHWCGHSSVQGFIAGTLHMHPVELGIDARASEREEMQQKGMHLQLMTFLRAAQGSVQGAGERAGPEDLLLAPATPERVSQLPSECSSDCSTGKEDEVRPGCACAPHPET